MVFSSLAELDVVLSNYLSTREWDAVAQRIYAELGDKDSLEKLLRIVFENPNDFIRTFSKHLYFLNLYGTFLAKAYSIALLLLDERRIVLNPVMLVNELYRPHYLVSLYNPLVLTYLYLNHSDHYEHNVWRTLQDQLIIYEFNPIHPTTYIYRDYLFHVSLKYKEFVSSLYGKCGLRNSDVLEKVLQGIPVENIALAFKNYLRLVSSLLSILRVTLYTYAKSSQTISDSEGLSENLLKRIRLIRDNYRHMVSTSINRQISMINALLDIEGMVFRDSLVKLFEILTSNYEVFRQSVYEVLVFTYETYRFKQYEEQFKRINYSYINSLAFTIYKLVSVVDKVVLSKDYLDLLKETLYREGEPYSSLRERLSSLEGDAPRWLEELRSR